VIHKQLDLFGLKRKNNPKFTSVDYSIQIWDRRYEAPRDKTIVG